MLNSIKKIFKQQKNNGMIKYTTLEKMAMSRVLHDIIKADGRISDGELAYLHQIRGVLEMSMSDMKEAIDMSVSISLSVVKDMSTFQKEAFAIMMIEMMRADGDIAESETMIIAHVCAFADINLPVIS